MSNTAPGEIQTLIENHVNGFNAQDSQLFAGVFSDAAIIIDGIAPYRWLNPNAPANWLADVEKWRQDLGVTRNDQRSNRHANGHASIYLHDVRH